MYTTTLINKIVGGILQGIEKNADIKYLATDSRKIFFPAETIFFGIVSHRGNGHHYIEDAYEQGVRSFIVSEAINNKMFPEAEFILVENTLQALQQLAAHHRNRFHIPVIGVTGSNGKTIVKEWLHQLLHIDYNIVRSPRSYNSQIGVPLSVWEITTTNTLGIFEAGISMPGEMELLQQIIQPTIGVLTNMGTAHDEGFSGRQQKLQEKSILFRSADYVVCKDELAGEMHGLKNRKLYTWGSNDNAGNTVFIQSVTKHIAYTTICLKGNFLNSSESTFEYTIPFTDDASIENAMTCFTVCCLLGMNVHTIAERMKQLHPVEMRLEWKKAINNSYLINDSYSNDISSLTMALNYLGQQRQTQKETVILSDVFQSGMTDEVLYVQIASLLRRWKIERIICIGPAISRYEYLFADQQMQTANFPSTDAFIKQFDTLQFKEETILLKGARSFCFEKIAALLELQVHQTVLEINLTALINNLNRYRGLLQPETRIMVMVKAFGYGSGSAEIAKVLQFNKVDYLAVAYTDEGIALRQAGIHVPIMVMNPEPTAFDALYDYNLEPEIYSFDLLQSFFDYCDTQALTSFPIHLKLDTGMHRLGFEKQEIDKLATFLTAQQLLKVKTVFTHLVASEDAKEDDFTKQQMAEFNAMSDILQYKLSYPILRHAANTAAISRHPAAQMDMVRLGIGLYGVDSAEDLNLEVVSTLKSTVAQIKYLHAGDTVGYNRKGIITKDTKIATIRIGYADGFSRKLSNGKGFVYIHGRKAPVIGNVCMDMTMIDVTGIAVQPGDEVEIFGGHISIQQFAAQCGTIAYEIMTGIGQRVKRIYFEE